MPHTPTTHSCIIPKASLLSVSVHKPPCSPRPLPLHPPPPGPPLPLHPPPPRCVIPKASVLSRRTTSLAALLEAEQLGGGLALTIAAMYEAALGKESFW